MIRVIMNNIEVGSKLNKDEADKNKIQRITEEQYHEIQNDENTKHNVFINQEEWRKFCEWGYKKKLYAVDTKETNDGNVIYVVKEIKEYDNTLRSIIHCQSNLDSLFKYHPSLNQFKFDEYSKTKEFNDDKYDEDTTPSIIFNFFRRNFGEWCPRADIKETIAETIDKNKYNFFKDWLESHTWDGEERLDTFLIDYYGAEDTPLVRAYFSRWMIALIKRTYEPGAKFDSMLILASIEHGKKKTSLFEWLGKINGRKLYNDAPDDLRKLEELVYASKGRAILMFDDFDDICDKGQIGKVKSFITQRSRTAALKWQHEKDYDITYVLSGSTNNISILVDDGTFDERRFWIVEVNPTTDVFDLPEELKEQLYAEALYRYKNDPSQYLWIHEPELKQMEIEWQKKYKKANEDTMTETIIKIFNRKYPIKNGMFKDEDEFLRLVNQDINNDENAFLGNNEEYNHIKIIPSAWITKYLQSAARGTDRIVQILHTHGFKVEKRQRYHYNGIQLTCIIINN